MSSDDFHEGPAILFVDDDVGNLRVLEIHLARDFLILTAQNGTEALEILERRHQEIGLVVSDQRMAGMSGVEFLVKVRQDYPKIERMIITAYADLPPIIEAINSGRIGGYISKPWNPTELRVMLRSGVERYNLRRSLEEAQLKLFRSEQNSVLGFLAAGVGHEVNNPCGVILMNLQLLTENLEPLLDAWQGASAEVAASHRERIDEIRRCVGECEDAVGALAVISADLRELSLQERSEEPTREPTDVNAIAQRCLRFLQKQIEYRGEVRESLAATRGVSIHPGRLTQVMINLCTNAMQAMDRVEDDRAPLLSVTSHDHPDGGEVLVEIEDNGVGIPSEILPRVFDPFFTTKEDALGLGLGLAISRNIVESAGGRIELRSSPSLGTTFTLGLPVWQEREARSEREDGDSPTSAGEARPVLVIEDDEALRRVLRRALGARYEVETASGGAEGLERLETGRYGAAVCDMMMPRPDGRDVYRQLVAQRSPLAERFVLITGGAVTPACRDFLHEVENRIDVLFKPFAPAKLCAAIERALRR